VGLRQIYPWHARISTSCCTPEDFDGRQSILQFNVKNLVKAVTEYAQPVSETSQPRHSSRSRGIGRYAPSTLLDAVAGSWQNLISNLSRGRSELASVPSSLGPHENSRTRGPVRGMLRRYGQSSAVTVNNAAVFIKGVLSGRIRLSIAMSEVNPGPAVLHQPHSSVATFGGERQQRQCRVSNRGPARQRLLCWGMV